MRPLNFNGGPSLNGSAFNQPTRPQQQHQRQSAALNRMRDSAGIPNARQSSSNQLLLANKISSRAPALMTSTNTSVSRSFPDRIFPILSNSMKQSMHKQLNNLKNLQADKIISASVAPRTIDNDIFMNGNYCSNLTSQQYSDSRPIGLSNNLKQHNFGQQSHPSSRDCNNYSRSNSASEDDDEEDDGEEIIVDDLVDEDKRRATNNALPYVPMNSSQPFGNNFRYLQRQYINSTPDNAPQSTSQEKFFYHVQSSKSNPSEQSSSNSIRQAHISKDNDYQAPSFISTKNHMAEPCYNKTTTPSASSLSSSASTSSSNSSKTFASFSGATSVDDQPPMAKAAATTSPPTHSNEMNPKNRHDSIFASFLARLGASSIESQALISLLLKNNCFPSIESQKLLQSQMAKRTTASAAGDNNFGTINLPYDESKMNYSLSELLDVSAKGMNNNNDIDSTMKFNSSSQSDNQPSMHNIIATFGNSPTCSPFYNTLALNKYAPPSLVSSTILNNGSIGKPVDFNCTTAATSASSSSSSRPASWHLDHYPSNRFRMAATGATIPLQSFCSSPPSQRESSTQSGRKASLSRSSSWRTRHDSSTSLSLANSAGLSTTANCLIDFKNINSLITSTNNTSASSSNYNIDSFN